MRQINEGIIEGRLVRNPETTFTKFGRALTKMTIANNVNYKKGGEWKTDSNFFPVEVWAGLAELTQSFCKKGDFVRIKYHLKQDRWEDKEGKARTTIILVATSIDWNNQKRDDEEPGEDTNE